MDPATLTAAAALATTGINAISQGSLNKKTRQWNEAQYQRQRTDALSDWARTNEYNAPLQQMARFKEAGLSPHLIYGGGATSMSQPVRSTDTKSWSPTAPQIDGGQIVSQYFGVQQQQNALQIQKEQIQGLKLDNMYKQQTLPDRAEAPYLSNQKTINQIDNLLADINMTRAKTSLQGLEFDKLQEEVKQLVTNNSWNNLNKTVEYKIKGFMAEQIQLINKGQINKNNISEIEAKWKQTIDEWVGPAGGLTSSIIKILITSMTK